MKLYVGLRGAAISAEIRTETFDGREHLVVPVVMMVGDAVIRPLGSTGPEFVPAAELSALPESWNGRPVVTDHPDGGMGSANRKEVIESMAFGVVLNSTWRSNRLQAEAWIDVEKAERLGGDAQNVIDRIREDETVEVSVGCWITAERKAGRNARGEAYEVVWSDIVPDHLALLPIGTEGACSIDMGCGTPRSATVQQQRRLLRVANKSLEEQMNWTKILGAMRSLMQRAEPSDRAVREQITDIAESLRASQEGMSDGDLRAALWQLLESAVAAFEWVEAVYPDDHEVIYTTWPPDEGPKMWVRSYSVDESGEVTLTSEPVEVEAVLRYEPVSTAAEAATGENDDDGSERVTSTVENDDEPKASEQPPPCSCNEPKGATEKMNENVKALIGRLIASAASPFESSDEEMLANFCEGTLVKLAESYEAIDATADEEEYEEEYEDEEVEEDEDTVSVSATELAELKQLAAEQRARTKREKDALVSKLVGATGEGSRSTFESMELAALRQLASDLKVNEPRPDFALAEGGDPAIAPDAPDPAPSLKSAAREDHERRWNRGGVN